MGPIDINRNNYARLTRYQNRQIKKIFPFTKLPAEIRNMIYELCLSFGGIEKFFDRYYDRLKRARKPRDIDPPGHKRTTPTILLLNREIYAEAIGLLGKQTVRFEHGMLNIEKITGKSGVICRPALRNVGTIVVTTKGHPILQQNIVRLSWYGYMELLAELAAVLSKGHQVKKLVVDFSDTAIIEHLGRCWNLHNICEFRDDLKEALNELRGVRGVRCVEFKGLNEVFARELKAHMESKPRSFLDLPGEVRNKIYYHTAGVLSWPIAAS